MLSKLRTWVASKLKGAKMGLDLLRAAAFRGMDANSDGLREGALRFHLEYPEHIDVDVAREQISALLGADNFALRTIPGGGDPSLLLLDFPGIDREQSSELLFTEASELVDALGLVSCTPEISPGYHGPAENLNVGPESVGKLVSAYCLSKLTPPADALWSVKAVRADRAWALGAKGQGVLIGQPDTGVADHSEIANGLDLSKGIDLIKGSGPPVDPLTAKGGNPGHGTATSSVAVSRSAGVICGTAPDATLVPLRCVESVILLGGAAVAAAIDHARAQGCHVVTMSLGGPLEFPALRRAIERAVDAGMIVLAAAGNCVGIVVYPAWDANVIAVAGTNQHGQRWTGSSHGAAVDIAAPGEHVWVARRSRPTDPNHTEVVPSEGTSFAVATTAGVVALWLSHHGVANVRAAAAARGVNVQALCRAALRQSARRPDGWPNGLGAGIVDAEALIALPLADIDMSGPKYGGNPAQTLMSGVFDWNRFAPEAGFLAFDQALRAVPQQIDARESPVIPHPSPQLAKALAEAGRPDRFAAPALVSAPLTPLGMPRAALLALAGPKPDGKGGTTESVAVLTEATAREWLGAAGKDELVNLTECRLGKLNAADDTRSEITKLRRAVIAEMPATIEKLASGVHPDALDPVSRISLESLIRMTGRPVLRIVDGWFDTPATDDMGEWVSLLTGATAKNWLTPMIAATGRLDAIEDGNATHLGTGTLIAERVVMTNRHVLDAFADLLPGGGFKLRRTVGIDFNASPGNPDQYFPVKRVLWAGAQPIGMRVDLDKLDMAFLEIGPALNAKPPRPLGAPNIGGMPAAMNQIAVIGYPAPPGSGAVIDPNTQRTSLELIDRHAELFQNKYGVKYLSPGLVESRVGTVHGDTRKWAFGHDAMTLGGNSGSPVLAFESQLLCGIHFGGMPLRQNLGHGMVPAHDALVANPALATGAPQLAWFGQ
jgi:serine protease